MSITVHAPAAGKVLAEIIVEGKSSTFDMGPFDYPSLAPGVRRRWWFG